MCLLRISQITRHSFNLIKQQYVSVPSTMGVKVSFMLCWTSSRRLHERICRRHATETRLCLFLGRWRKEVARTAPQGRWSRLAVASLFIHDEFVVTYKYAVPRATAEVTNAFYWPVILAWKQTSLVYKDIYVRDNFSSYEICHVFVWIYVALKQKATWMSVTIQHLKIH